jgi:arginase family enzyme
MMGADELGRLWAEACGRGGVASAGASAGAGLLGLPLVDDPAALTGLGLVAMGLPLGSGASLPEAVRRASLAYADWPPALAGGFRAADYGDVEVVDDDPAVAFMQAHERLADIVAAGAAPLVIGGDALVSVPVLQVLSGKLRGRLGVVAFTPAYDVAPDPLYSAGSRWARALELGMLSPANLVLVGGRAAPPDEPARRVLDRLGATVFSVADVVRDGIEAVMQEAVETASGGTEAVYVSVDLAVLAGIGDPVGLEARELTAGIAGVSGVLLAAADICGAGPGMDGAAGPAAAARAAAEIVAGVAGRLR